MKKISIATGVLITVLLAAVSSFAQTQSRDDILKQIVAKRAELAALEKEFLAPTEDDRAAHAEFLRLPDTGLIRLLPREVYESEVYKKNKKTLTVRGGGAYYSFTARTHEYSGPTDIGLEGGRLQTGFAGANYGMLTSLGDVPLENINLESPAVHGFAMHVPAPDEPKARIEQRASSNGATIEGTSYTNRLPLTQNSTYLLRAVNYDASDVLVVFRVVRIDDDSSAIILWKLLKKYPKPHLARN
jgi:hypothetical protein